MKILFAATDKIAVPLLEALHKKGLCTLVFTSPDAPKKRGKGFVPTPVKEKALELGLPVFTPEHLNKPEREIVESYSLDTLLSFSYGRISNIHLMFILRFFRSIVAAARSSAL